MNDGFGNCDRSHGLAFARIIRKQKKESPQKQLTPKQVAYDKPSTQYIARNNLISSENGNESFCISIGFWNVARFSWTLLNFIQTYQIFDGNIVSHEMQIDMHCLIGFDIKWERARLRTNWDYRVCVFHWLAYTTHTLLVHRKYVAKCFFVYGSEHDPLSNSTIVLVFCHFIGGSRRCDEAFM